jgi:O-antigen/teichoic acid export membrane protein
MSPHPLAPSPATPPPSPGEGERLHAMDTRAALRGRARQWAGILSAYLSTQTVTQLLGIATGLLFIRTMPVGQFALYTLAFSVITFFNFLSDLGSTTSLLHFFHRSAQTGEDFRPYAAAVLSLRRAAFTLGAVAVAVAFPLVASSKGFGGWDVGPATAGILLCSWFQILVSLRLLDLRLHGFYGLSYRAEMAGAALRLALAGAMVLAALLQAWIGVLATAVGTGLTAFLARPREAPEDLPAAVSGTALAPYRRQILRYLLPTLPGALYFSVQGPLIVWLSATFGSARNIAEVGALGRLGLLVGIFSGLVNTVFLPRLSHVTDERLYRRRFLQFGALLAGLAAAMTAAATLFPGPLLFVLGRHYSGLRSELVLVVAGAGFNLLDGYLVSINLARSWTRWQSGSLVLLVLGQAAMISLLPLSRTWNVLLFNLLGSVLAFLLQALTTLAGFRRPKWVYWA